MWDDIIQKMDMINIFPNISDVEDLTHKTGNFKQFSIFVSMLESAIKQVGIWKNYFHDIFKIFDFRKR